MGRNKILIQKIKDERFRNITYYKRKKGLVKKAMELSLLCDADILVCVYPKHIAYRQLLIFSTTNNADNFIDKYIKNPLIKKEIFGLKDYGALFTNNILNEEQVKQINDIENDNTDKMGKMINNNNIFNLDKNKINFVGFPTLFNFNKDNKIINEPLDMKNLFKNINIDNNKNQNILISNNKINNKFDALSSNGGGTEKFQREIEIKENNLSDKNILNLPNIPSFFNDRTEETSIQNNKYMNINNNIFNNNIFNNNMINISNIHNNLLNNFFNKDYANNIFSKDKKKDLNQMIPTKCQIPTNTFFNNNSNNNLNNLNLLNLPNNKDIFRPIPPALNIPLYPLNKNINNNNNEHIFNLNGNRSSSNNSFLGQKRLNINS